MNPYNLSSGDVVGDGIPSGPEARRDTVAPSSPPASNTGVLSAQKKVLIDALSFTLHGDNSLSDSDWLLGPTGWEALESGRSGYKYAERRGNLFRYSGGKDGMGTHITGMGKACRELEADGVVYDWPMFFQAVLRAHARFSRFDIAVDDRAGELDLTKIVEATKKGNVVTPFRSIQIQESFNTTDFSSTGLTIYYGSRKSESMVRIYDKAKEQGIDGHYIRVEVECKGEFANRVAQYAAYNDDLLYLEEILYRLIDFKEPGENKQKCRWETVNWWKGFLDTFKKTRLTMKPERRSCEDVERWLKRQVAPSLAMVAIGMNWDIEQLGNLVQEGIAGLKPRHKAMINEVKGRAAKDHIST